MKTFNKLIIAIFMGSILASFSGTQVFAQADQDEVQLYQTIYGMEKRNLIENSMNLSAETKDAFWTVYEEYEKERRALGKDRVATIKEYVQNMDTKDEMKMDEIAKKALAGESHYTKLYSNYYAKMKKVAGSATSFRWLQIERYLENSIKMAISEELPFLPDAK